jgi:hypothetical protein
MATPTHVRVVRGNIGAGKLTTLVSAISQDVIPTLEDVQGFEGAELRVDDDGIACEFAMYFSDCPMGIAEIDDMYQSLLAKTLVPEIGAAVQDFRRLRIAYPREIAAD